MTTDHRYQGAHKAPPTKARQRSAPGPGHPVLVAQQQIGNRAVADHVRRRGGVPASASAVGNRVMSVQLREGDEAPAPAEDRGELIEQAVAEQVARLPGFDEAALVAPEGAEGARQEAEGAGGDLAALGVGGDDPVGLWYRSQLEVDGEANLAVVDELAGAQGDVELAEPTKPSLRQRLAASLSGGASATKSFFSRKARGIGDSLKRTFSRENRRDAGAKTQAIGGMGAPAAAHLNDFVAAGQHLVDNTATVGSATLLGGSGAANQVSHAGEEMGGVAQSATPSTDTLEHPGDYAHSFASGAFEALHQVAQVVGIFFSAIKAAMDIRSLVSTVRVIRGLKAAKSLALASQASPELVDAVDYAIRQKYEKVIKRAIGAAVALAALGIGLAILIANPVGASLAAIILGGIGAGVFVYKVGRFVWKKWKTKTLGVKRAEIAQRLYDQLGAGEASAKAAVRSLHLDPDAVVVAPNGPKLILRKLKSS